MTLRKNKISRKQRSVVRSKRTKKQVGGNYKHLKSISAADVIQELKRLDSAHKLGLKSSPIGDRYSPNPNPRPMKSRSEAARRSGNLGVRRLGRLPVR
jgi:hypothetical protein